MDVIETQTPRGLARVHLEGPPAPSGALILGHGAGGGVQAADLQAAAAAALGLGMAVALIEQPYRVAGRRAPAPAPALDEARAAVVTQLRAAQLSGLKLVLGGRSMGARVACRTAATLQAAGVLCLAFPLLPPRRSAQRPATSRLSELEASGVPTLIIQGERDPFGMPPEAPQREVVRVASDHSLRGEGSRVREAVSDWLPTVLSR